MAYRLALLDTGEASLAADRTTMLRVSNLTRNVDEEHLNKIFGELMNTHTALGTTISSGTYARVESVHLAVDERVIRQLTSA